MTTRAKSNSKGMDSSQVTSTTNNTNPEKVTVVLLPMDNLPKLKNNKFMIGAQQDFHFIIKFLNDKLKSALSGGVLVFNS